MAVSFSQLAAALNTIIIVSEYTYTYVCVHVIVKAV